MTIIVEDGTGLEDANSYISVDTANDYFALRGNAQWDDTDDEIKEASLVKATDYIGLRWGHLLRGTKATETQALEFPRLYTSSAEPCTPSVLFKACAEYAFRESVSPLMPDPSGFDDAGRFATKTVDEVGPIREERSYASSGAAAAPQLVRDYPTADALMRTLVVSSSRVIRA